MNYLGHLFLSNDNFDLIVNNLFGDFVKGSNLSHYEENIQKGILFHRSIDSFIDNHKSVIELSKILRPDLPKISKVAIDLYFDHLLAKNWSKYHFENLNDYIENFYINLSKHHIEEDLYSSNFVKFKYDLLKYKFISFYSTEYGLDKMCNGVAKRISFETTLPNGLNIYKKNQKVIEQAFENYMEDAIIHFDVYK